jgi:hypothetical protein
MWRQRRVELLADRKKGGNEMANWTRLSATAFVLVIASSPATAQTPVLELQLDEGSGTTAVNSGSLGAAADGAVTGATYSANTPFGTGFALSFDGDTDFVDVADAYDYGSPGVLLAISSGVLQFNLSTVLS